MIALGRTWRSTGKVSTRRSFGAATRVGDRRAYRPRGFQRRCRGRFDRATDRPTTCAATPRRPRRSRVPTYRTCSKRSTAVIASRRSRSWRAVRDVHARVFDDQIVARARTTATTARSRQPSGTLTAFAARAAESRRARRTMIRVGVTACRSQARHAVWLGIIAIGAAACISMTARYLDAAVVPIDRNGRALGNCQTARSRSFHAPSMSGCGTVLVRAYDWASGRWTRSPPRRSREAATNDDSAPNVHDWLPLRRRRSRRPIVSIPTPVRRPIATSPPRRPETVDRCGVQRRWHRQRVLGRRIPCCAGGGFRGACGGCARDLSCYAAPGAKLDGHRRRSVTVARTRVADPRPTTPVPQCRLYRWGFRSLGHVDGGADHDQLASSRTAARTRAPVTAATTRASNRRLKRTRCRWAEPRVVPRCKSRRPWPSDPRGGAKSRFQLRQPSRHHRQRRRIRERRCELDRLDFLIAVNSSSRAGSTNRDLLVSWSILQPGDVAQGTVAKRPGWLLDCFSAACRPAVGTPRRDPKVAPSRPRSLKRSTVGGDAEHSRTAPTAKSRRARCDAAGSVRCLIYGAAAETRCGSARSAVAVVGARRLIFAYRNHRRRFTVIFAQCRRARRENGASTPASAI